MQGSRTLAAGRPEEAAQHFREALALWRGPALADLAEQPSLRGEIARLEELRLAALERRIEADLILGRHTELVPELDALVARHPLRERLCGNLMLALYGSGRQAEALAAYRAARAILADELGIEPSPYLRELERRILHQDPALQPATIHSGATPAATLVPPLRAIVVAPREGACLDALVALAQPLAKDSPRELVLASLVADEHALREAARAAGGFRTRLLAQGTPVRAAAFTTSDRGQDLVRLASEQEASLLLVDPPDELLAEGELGTELDTVLAEAPCDVAILVPCDEGPAFAGQRILVPFGGHEHEWAAVEVAAWLARAHGASLGLVGTRADPRSGRRDASRLLATASLVLQRVADIDVEPRLVAPGLAGVLDAAEDAGLLVVGVPSSWRRDGLGRARLTLVRSARPPKLVVRGGARPGGLASGEPDPLQLESVRTLGRSREAFHRSS